MLFPRTFYGHTSAGTYNACNIPMQCLDWLKNN
uniref:Uncharacterized protein n=1 Tax=Arundo donax TaxID=35708 RepID=A0A0A9AMX5_ARUDO